jgi:hypothetical protein
VMWCRSILTGSRQAAVAFIAPHSKSQRLKEQN